MVQLVGSLLTHKGELAYVPASLSSRHHILTCSINFEMEDKSFTCCFTSQIPTIRRLCQTRQFRPPIWTAGTQELMALRAAVHRADRLETGAEAE